MSEYNPKLNGDTFFSSCMFSSKQQTQKIFSHGSSTPLIC